MQKFIVFVAKKKEFCPMVDMNILSLLDEKLCLISLTFRILTAVKMAAYCVTCKQALSYRQ